MSISCGMDPRSERIADQQLRPTEAQKRAQRESNTARIRILERRLDEHYALLRALEEHTLSGGAK